MSFKVEIEITPDADGVHCGECQQRPSRGVCWCWHYKAQVLWLSDPKPIRCPACLAVEKAWREKNP